MLRGFREAFEWDEDEDWDIEPTGPIWPKRRPRKGRTGIGTVEPMVPGWGEEEDWGDEDFDWDREE